MQVNSLLSLQRSLSLFRVLEKRIDSTLIEGQLWKGLRVGNDN